MTLSRNKKSLKSTNNVRIDIIFNEQNDELPGRLFCLSRNSTAEIGHFTVIYFVAKSLSWSEAEGDLVVIKIVSSWHDKKVIYI